MLNNLSYSDDDGFQGDDNLLLGDGTDFYASQTQSADINGDGIIDSFITFYDTNHDGVYDGEQIVTDSNGDGIADLVSQTTYMDTNGDGIIDTVTYAQDSNGDGVFDVVSAYSDTNGDGVFEAVNTYSDVNGDGKMELIDSSGYKGYQSYFTQTPTESDLPNYSEDNPNIDPNSVVGDPADDMQYWEFQGESGPCALFAQMFAVEDLTGQHCDINDFIDVASQNGWYDGGTPIPDIGKMLDYYGLTTETHEHGSMDDIKDCLEHNGKVVVAVDGDEIWYDGHDSSAFAPNDPNHCIEVIGIDYTDPNNPMVIVNDSGTPDGEGMMVPLDKFTDAWDDSGNFMVEAYS